MAAIIDGKQISKDIKEELKKEIANLPFPKCGRKAAKAGWP